jgi:hypothetical protein
MAKTTSKARKLTTNQALEQLLGRKAAKRLRQVAVQLAANPKKAKKKR